MLKIKKKKKTMLTKHESGSSHQKDVYCTWPVFFKCRIVFVLFYYVKNHFLLYVNNV